jgi:type I restriction enzyme M protein
MLQKQTALQNIDKYLKNSLKFYVLVPKPRKEVNVKLTQNTLIGSNNGATLGFEEKLWKSSDKLRNNMDAGEYKHVVLGLVFLKYISDAFEERQEQLLKEKSQGGDPEDKDEYLGHNIFWVSRKARWGVLQASAKLPTIGKVIDAAMLAIELENPPLKGVLPKDYSRPSLDKERLGQLIDLIGSIGLGHSSNRSKDILGRVYEYFLGQFASAEGKKGGQFYTPRSVVKLLVEIIEPFNGRVYDPCCGSGGMFVQSEKFVLAHGGKKGDISIYGQESNHTTWRLCKMNLAIRGIDGNIGEYNADSFRNDLHNGLKSDFILANPPFNDSDWNGDQLRDDVRWSYGIPPRNNANFAWVQHFIHHLSKTGIAGFVLANGSMSSDISNEGDIRKAIIEADLVDCMISLPGQLFYSTMIPACLWFIARDKKHGRFRDRAGEILFIDARNMGVLIDRVHRELTEQDIAIISKTYHSWRNTDSRLYRDELGFCKSSTIKEIANQRYVLSPARYVGIKNDDNNEKNGKTFSQLVNQLNSQFSESRRLESVIRKAVFGELIE